jgi:hypothetical protein
MAMPINRIPAENVGEVVQSFVSNDGVTHLDVSKQADGTYTVAPLQQSFSAMKTTKPWQTRRGKKGP